MVEPTVFEVEQRTINVDITSPDQKGNVDFKFSRKIQLPANVTDWTSENEGAESLNITFFPSSGTLDALPDTIDSFRFSWRVNTVNSGSRNGTTGQQRQLEGEASDDNAFKLHEVDSLEL